MSAGGLIFTLRKVAEEEEAQLQYDIKSDTVAAMHVPGIYLNVRLMLSTPIVRITGQATTLFTDVGMMEVQNRSQGWKIEIWHVK